MALDDPRLREILTRARTIAVVGLSDKPDRDSNEMARYLQGQGYRIIPVNPSLSEVLGEPSYPSLSAIPAETKIDIVDIFRRGDQVPAVVDEAIRRGAGVIWTPLGVESVEGGEKARAASVPMIQNLCIMQQHRRLHIPPKSPPA